MNDSFETFLLDEQQLLKNKVKSLKQKNNENAFNTLELAIAQIEYDTLSFVFDAYKERKM